MCLWHKIYWAILPDESGNYENSGGEASLKCLKLNGKPKLNSLAVAKRYFELAESYIMENRSEQIGLSEL